MQTKRYDNSSISERVTKVVIDFFNANQKEYALSKSSFENLLSLGAYCTVGTDMRAVVFASVYFIIYKTNSEISKGDQLSCRTPISVKTPIGIVDKEKLKRYRYIVYEHKMADTIIEYPESMVKNSVSVKSGSNNNSYYINSSDVITNGYSWVQNGYSNTLYYYNDKITTVILCGKVERDSNQYSGCLLQMVIHKEDDISEVIKSLSYLATQYGYNGIIIPQSKNLIKMYKLPESVTQYLNLYKTFDIDCDCMLPWVIV